MPPRRRGGSDPGGDFISPAADAAAAAIPPMRAAGTTMARSTLSKLIPKPEKYSGRGDVVLFVYSLINYYALVALADAVEMDDATKLLMTSAFLSDAALTWYRAHVPRFKLFNELCEGLLSQFGDLNIESTARTKLEKLKQTGSVQGYMQIFQETGLLLSTPTSDFFATHEAHHAFTRGLLPEIRTAVAMTQKGNKDCREAMMLASAYDSARRMGGAAGPSRETERVQDKEKTVRFNDPMFGRFNNNNGNNFNKGFSNNRFNNQRPANSAKFNTRVNRAETNSDNAPPRACWNCGDPDHLADKCHLPPKNARMAALRRK
jgi:hypothetical protein